MTFFYLSHLVCPLFFLNTATFFYFVGCHVPPGWCHLGWSTLPSPSSPSDATGPISHCFTFGPTSFTGLLQTNIVMHYYEQKCTDAIDLNCSTWCAIKSTTATVNNRPITSRSSDVLLPTDLSLGYKTWPITLSSQMKYGTHFSFEKEHIFSLYQSNVGPHS